MKAAGLAAACWGILFPAGLIFMFSRLSGWDELAKQYPLSGEFPPVKKRMGYGVFRGWIGYNGGIIVSSDQGGLYLRAMPVILSFCHGPIFIPWREITAIETVPRWFGRIYALRTARAPRLHFGLRPGTFAVIREDAKRAGVPGNY